MNPASSPAEPASSSQQAGVVQPRSWPFITPQTSAVTAAGASTAPSPSSGGAAAPRDSGISTAPATSVRPTAGTLIQNTEAQEKRASSRPPSTGPSGRPSAVPAGRMPIALGRSGSPDVGAALARGSGSPTPPPSPIGARAAISPPADPDSAHHSDAARKMPSPASSSRFRPIRSPTIPAGTITPAN